MRVAMEEALALPSSEKSVEGASSYNSERAAEEEEGVQTVVVGGAAVKLDKLGPVVVNSDGTLSRIANWHEMTEAEQQKTLRVVGKRNQSRMAALKAKADEQQ